MKNLIFTIFLFVVSIAIAAAQADDVTINYAPDNNLFLGSSIDYRFPERSKQRAIKNTRAEVLDGTTAKTTIFNGTLISDITTLYNKLDISYDVSASGTIIPFAKASAELDTKLLMEDDNSSSKLYYLIEATADFGKEGYSSPELNSAAANLITADPDKFVEAYGTHFVQFLNKKSSVYLLYQIETNSKYSKQYIYAKYHSKLDFSVVDVASIHGEQTAEFTKFSLETKNTTNVKIRFFSRSGSGLNSIASLVDTAKSLPSIVNNLKVIMGDPSLNIGAVSSYRLTSFEPYGLNIKAISTSQQSFIKRFANIKAQLLYAKYNFGQLLPKINNFNFKQYYAGKLTEVNNALSQINQLENDCYANKNCDNVTLESLGNIPLHWLKDIILINNVIVYPSYDPYFDASGHQVGEILKGCRVECQGTILNREYFSNMYSAYIDPDFIIRTTQNETSNGNNIQINHARENQSFKEADFRFITDAVNADNFLRDASGNILDNRTNIDIANKLIDNIKLRNYFIVCISRDNTNFYFDLGLVDVTELVSRK